MILHSRYRHQQHLHDHWRDNQEKVIVIYMRKQMYYCIHSISASSILFFIKTL